MIARSAGILVPLFSLRTRDDVGRGDILDLEPMIDFAVAMGHRVIQLLPLDETAPDELSPYSAMSVMAIDPMYISIRGLGGVGRVVAARARTTVGKARVVAREIVRRERLALLTRMYGAWRSRGDRGERVELEAFVEANRYWLDDYALFRALKERFDWHDWEQWPRELKAREADALSAARAELADQIAMYAYWQFVAHRQWKRVREYAAARDTRLGGDLAFSPCRDSAEVWANQADFDLSRTVGAPPDGFNPNGQRWGLPLPHWERMRAGGFRTLSARVKHAQSMYDLMRVDHVIGLYRTFNFGLDPNQPGTFTPAEESEQLRQGEEVISLIKKIAATTEVIAEDLGTVPPWARASLTRLGVSGYKVMQWERLNWGEPNETYLSPAQYPELSLATTGTHDTEALTTWWHAQDVGEREKFLRALALEGQVNPKRMMDEASRAAILEVLYASPARLVVLPIQDLFGWSARINRPGTVSDSNWTYRLPLTIERMRRSRAMRSQISALREMSIRTGRFTP